MSAANAETGTVQLEDQDNALKARPESMGKTPWGRMEHNRDPVAAQGGPFAGVEGGLLETRSFGGAQVERTFSGRGQRGQQLLLGAYQALEQQIAAGTVTMHPRTEMLDLVVINGQARGIVTRNLQSGAIQSFLGDVVVLATGGYSNFLYPSTTPQPSHCTALWRAHRPGA